MKPQFLPKTNVITGIWMNRSKNSFANNQCLHSHLVRIHNKFVQCIEVVNFVSIIVGGNWFFYGLCQNWFVVISVNQSKLNLTRDLELEIVFSN